MQGEVEVGGEREARARACERTSLVLLARRTTNSQGGNVHELCLNNGKKINKARICLLQI
jgi:hypothetical protein